MVWLTLKSIQRINIVRNKRDRLFVPHNRDVESDERFLQYTFYWLDQQSLVFPDRIYMRLHSVNGWGIVTKSESWLRMVQLQFLIVLGEKTFIVDSTPPSLTSSLEPEHIIFLINKVYWESSTHSEAIASLPTRSIWHLRHFFRVQLSQFNQICKGKMR